MEECVLYVAEKPLPTGIAVQMASSGPFVVAVADPAKFDAMAALKDLLSRAGGNGDGPRDNAGSLAGRMQEDD